VDPTQTTVSRLLTELEEGHDAAAGELFALLYEELRALAHRHRLRWRDDYTLNTTALVHEAYLKLVGHSSCGVTSRAHFFGLASKAIRHILCNYARDRRALKRGGGLERLPFEDDAALSVPAAGAGEAEVLVALDDALRRLDQVYPRLSRVVECRFFGGLSIEETAATIGVSPRTVKRDWAVAQAWLHREMAAGV
jgi:RNA polymerase sigma factor (TIGR02999 family)